MYATSFTSICGRTILNLPDSALWPANRGRLPRPPGDVDEPVFAEPWQAGAFALAVRLSAEGHFTWTEWAIALAHELQADAGRGEADDGSRYYHCWLAALERLAVEKHLCDGDSLLACKEAWADAYRHTPHGKPVELDDDFNA